MVYVSYGEELLSSVHFWDGVILFDGTSVAMHEDCCCVDCTFCQYGTFNDVTSATVDFTGTIANDDCSTCQADIMTPTFELSPVALPSSSPFDPCCYKLEGDLGCNSGGYGFTKLQFCWVHTTGTYFQGQLKFYYECNDGSNYGLWKWFGSAISYSPTKYDCTTAQSYNSGSNSDSGCSPYSPCSMLNVNAGITFNT